MKPLKILSSLFIAITLALSLGCAATSTREGTGEYIDDSVITSKVKATIFSESTLKSSEINVETFKGIVQLSGFVRSQVNIDKAVDLTSRVPGVLSVRNAMLIK